MTSQLACRPSPILIYSTVNQQSNQLHPRDNLPAKLEVTPELKVNLEPKVQKKKGTGKKKRNQWLKPPRHECTNCKSTLDSFTAGTEHLDACWFETEGEADVIHLQVTANDVSTFNKFLIRYSPIIPANDT